MDAIPDCTPPLDGRVCAQWEAPGYILRWEREIVNISGVVVTIDQPVVHNIDANFGGGTMYKVSMPRIAEVGFEDLRLESVYAEGLIDSDENHAWTAIQFNAVEHSYVQRVECWHFAFSCVHTQKNSRYITTSHSMYYDGASLLTGGRRYSFFTAGQMNLVTECHTRNGRHDYVTDSTVSGPNVFHDSTAEQAHNDIGPHHRYATGILWDKLQGWETAVWDRGNLGSGHGWSGAYNVFWNVVASKLFGSDGTVAELNIDSPPGATNIAAGCISDAIRGPGIHDSAGLHVFPLSLYEAQLSARQGVPYFECPILDPVIAPCVDCLDGIEVRRRLLFARLDIVCC
jgi:hypothetical protein